jgi:hypothetical protein
MVAFGRNRKALTILDSAFFTVELAQAQYSDLIIDRGRLFASSVRFEMK